MLKYKEKEKGITLVSLIVTIIILLILVTISIIQLNNTKLFKRQQKQRINIRS